MDLSGIGEEVAKDEEGVIVPIFRKNSEPYLSSDGKPASVTVLGSESAKYRTARDSITRRALQAGARRGKLEPEDLLKNRVSLCAAVVIDWFGWEAGGKPAPCIEANVRELLKAEHILEQVEAGIANHSDFFEKPSTNSATT